ncbi:Fibronectin type III domain-containing protein [Promicromonospora thailandica]|uniref:Fibronectin type III domain-containing protein n=1 Tax=Promicromonospora thailandica TaxID=765201 RepID=A0A9X2G109_9MICO|nr:Fibronectin type III domain-containing protein [Promicromonospora thailandica]
MADAVEERFRFTAGFVVSWALVVLFTGALIALALAQDGEATAEVDLDDSGVWVTQTESGRLGRFNDQARALDSTLLAGSSTFDVQQQEYRVLLTDDGASTASPVDPAQLTLAGPVRAPRGAQLASGGRTTAILDPEDGRLWVLPFDGVTAFDEAELEPTAEVGPGGRLVVATDGTVFVAVAREGTLYRVATGGQGAPGEMTESDLPVADDAELEVTAVGDEPVVLDRTASALVLPDGEVVEIAGGAEARLQQPSPEARSVMVGTTTGLVAQPLGGGEATTRAAEGIPAAPVQVGACTFGAWSGSGQVVRDCPGADRDVDEYLEGADGELAYRVNRSVVVLNDVADGTLWMAAEDFEKVDDWDLTMPQDATGEQTETESTTPELVDQVVADRDEPNRAPTPKDDDLGVRPGRTTVLNVLGNDTDPDGDVMTVAVARPPSAASGVTVHRVLDGLALQADVPEDASGSVAFTYTVDDGRGGTADATVRLRVAPPGESAPPEPDGEPVLRVAQGGSATVKVLPYWRDPDGDDLVLSSVATTDPADRTRFRPDGTVEFRDGGGTVGRKLVDLTVADSTGQVGEGRLLVDVVAAQEPPVAVGDHVAVTAGRPVTVHPLVNDTDPNGDRLRLVDVAEQAPATITPHFAAGSFRFVSDEPGSYDLAYRVSDGPDAALGLVRVDVLPPPESGGSPVTVTDTVLLPAGGSALVDVVANDTDPAGGVLVVQSVTVPDDAPVTAAVLDHHVLRVAEARRPDGPVTLEYTVANGTGTAVGQVRVVPVPAATSPRPPTAEPDDATVHAGDVVTVPVLRNDSHPDGLELTLAEELVELPEDGEAFVSQDTVRFKAGPEQSGTVHLVYEVADPGGQRDSAQVTVTVVDDDENVAPQPPEVTARVLAGATTRIVLPLDGSDPDGDHVRLDAVASAPRAGTVDVVDGALEYEAAATASGEDRFTYSVVDTRGATAVGTVRVGVARPPQVNQPPLAVDDELSVRPGRTVGVDALANDSDPNGDQVGLVPRSFEGAPELSPEVADDLVVVTAPEDEGTHTFYYGIEDTFAARATGAVTVDVARDAPLLRPVARDDAVAPEDVTSSTVTVDVTGNDSDPDGLAADLVVTVPGAGPDGATVSDDGEVVVPLTARPQVVTYEVTDPDGLTAKAFLRVPRDGTPPRLREGLAPVEVTAGVPAELDLADYVVVAQGRTPRITDEAEVAATEGDHEVTGPTRVAYTAHRDYSGPAALTFEVTDGAGVDDPDGRTAVLSLPLQVLPGANEAPEIAGTPRVEAAAGEETALDLSRFVTDPDGDPLTVTAGPGGDGLSLATTGTTVRVTVAPDVPKGTSASVGFTVSDGNHPPVSGQLGVTVVASTRPLARATTDEVPDGHQGETTTVDVLANDVNPFPEEPLRLVAAHLESGRAAVEAAGDRVRVTPPADFHGVAVVRYRVADATGDPTREVEGVARVTVLGAPETPRPPAVEEVRSRTVVLSWDPPPDNGAPITEYRVRSGAGRTTTCPTTTCTVTGLTNDQAYTFTVAARNEVGTSGESGPSEEARPDEKPDRPAPPTLSFGDERLTVTWKNRSYTDRSPIECVNLEISPAPPAGGIQKTCLDGTSTVWDGLANGTAYTVRVQARNAAPDPSDWSDASAPQTPAAPPARPAAPRATRVDTAVGGQVTVRWTAPATNGAPVIEYTLSIYRDGEPAGTRVVSGTSQKLQGLDPRSGYQFAVAARNKAGTSPTGPRSAVLEPYGTPAVPGPPRAALISGDTNGKARVTWSGITDFRGKDPYYQVRADGSATKDATGSPTTVGGLANGQDHTFEVRACNAHTCSAWTARSNAVNPYTVPGAPPIDWFQDLGDDGNFRIWAAPSNGGRRVDRIEFRLSGDATREGMRENLSDAWQNGDHFYQVNVPTGANKSYTVRARLCNAAGCGEWARKSGSTGDTDSGRTLTSYKGASAVGFTNDDGTTCTRSTCAYLGLRLRGAQPNLDFGAACSAAGERFAPTAGGNLAFETTRDGRKLRTDADGSFTGELPCAWGTPGVEVYVYSYNWGTATPVVW